MAYSVEYYEKEDGSRPAEEFILSLDNKMQVKMFSTLELLEAKGPTASGAFLKAVDRWHF